MLRTSYSQCFPHSPQNAMMSSVPEVPAEFSEPDRRRFHLCLVYSPFYSVRQNSFQTRSSSSARILSKLLGAFELFHLCSIVYTWFFTSVFQMCVFVGGSLFILVQFLILLNWAAHLCLLMLYWQDANRPLYSKTVNCLLSRRKEAIKRCFELSKDFHSTGLSQRKTPEFCSPAC